MRYIWQHIATIIETYNGGIPLTHFLKNYFRQYPKLGSRDRKILSEMAYSWYRCSKGLDEELSFDDKIKACLKLTGANSKHIQPFLEGGPEAELDIENLFPFSIELSKGIEKTVWLSSMLQQPDVFLRMRKNGIVVKLLKEHNIPFKNIEENCIAVANGTAIDKILPEDSYVIQDASSQKTTEYFRPRDGEHWWDCCSGAGGKSLALCDANKNIELTVTDRRESILHNLISRFQQYHLAIPTYHILDVSDKVQVSRLLAKRQFDNIICDVPCSGSGTWARTPEQLYYFEERILYDLPALQTTIATHAAEYLKPGGRLFYITCSVFLKENEEVVNAIIKNTGLLPEHQQVINGIEEKADSMFIAVLKKNKD